MKVYSAFWDSHFPNHYCNLTAPEAGQIRTVYLNPSFLAGPLLYNSPRTFILYILWYPEYSQLNGWDTAHPSEIINSLVLQCELVIEDHLLINKVEAPRQIQNVAGTSARKFDVNILCVAPLMDFLKSQNQKAEETLFYSMTLANGKSPLIWTQCSSYEKVQLEKNIYYLEGYGIQETNLALIIEEKINNLTVWLQEQSYPWEENIWVGQHALNEQETHIFKDILSQAKSIY